MTKKLELIVFFKYCIKGLISKKNREEYINRLSSPLHFSITHPGNLNQEKIFYYIRLNAKSGFCVLYKNILELIYYADTFSFIPVVEFTKDVLYAEKYNIHGTNNAYEYYFMQPARISCDDILKNQNVIYAKMEDLNFFTSGNGGYSITDEDILKLSKINHKYIRIRDELLQEFDNKINEMFSDSKCIGVHVRGTDFKNNYKNHPIFIEPIKYLMETKKLMNKGCYSKVFLATDDQSIVELFKKEFKEKLIFYNDTLRSHNGQPIHLKKHERKNDRYLIGKEILRDVYTLSQCSALIASRSNVGIIARIMKLSTANQYEECIILDDGINVIGKTLKVK